MSKTISTKPLTNAQLMDSVPSIFQKTPHKSRSERYVHVPTIEVIDYLRKHGFVPVQAFESRILKDKQHRRNFAKHLIRLRERKYVETDKQPSLIPDIVLTNSHNGKCSFRLEAGLYRMVCSNGLIIRSEDHGTLRVPHSGQIKEKVREGCEFMSKSVPKILEATKAWDKIKLSQPKQINFAKHALELRFHGNTPPITTAQALEVRRNEDEAPTLWRVFNRLQENLMSGGITGKTANGRTVTTKRVTSVNNSLSFNRGLWELAEEVAERA